MNYGETKAQFTGLLNRRDITASQIETFLQQSIARIQRALRVPGMEKSVEVVGSGTSEVLIPTDYLELINLSYEQQRLRGVDLTTALKLAQCIGTPEVYCRRGASWVIGPAPGDGTTLRVDYYGEFDPLVLDADENFMTIVASDGIVYGALSYAADFFLDNRGPAFEERFTQILNQLAYQTERDEYSGSKGISPQFIYED